MNKRGICHHTNNPGVLHSIQQFMLIGLGLLFCICTYAQFSINGIEPCYDQRTHSFLISIPQSYWGKDYQANIVLTRNSTWKHAIINHQIITQPVVFEHIQGGKSYPIRVESDGKVFSYTLSFTFLHIIHLIGIEFGQYMVKQITSTRTRSGTDTVRVAQSQFVELRCVVP